MSTMKDIGFIRYHWTCFWQRFN